MVWDEATSSWKKTMVQCLKRGGACIATNDHNWNPDSAMGSRSMLVTLPKAATIGNSQARRSGAAPWPELWVDPLDRHGALQPIIP